MMIPGPYHCRPFSPVTRSVALTDDVQITSATTHEPRRRLSSSERPDRPAGDLDIRPLRSAAGVISAGGYLLTQTH